MEGEKNKMIYKVLGEKKHCGWDKIQECKIGGLSD